MHEVHAVKGISADAFEAAYRDGGMPLLAGGDDARLLWYSNHAHGSGLSNNVITVTAVRCGRLGAPGSDWRGGSRAATSGRGCATSTSCATT